MGGQGGHGTHLTLTLVQMIYSISSENGFWKVNELVLIQIHSLDLERNRYMTERTWPFSFTTCNKSNTSLVYMLGKKQNKNRFNVRLGGTQTSLMLSSTVTGTVRSNEMSRWVMDQPRKAIAATLTTLKGTYINHSFADRACVASTQTAHAV